MCYKIRGFNYKHKEKHVRIFVFIRKIHNFATVVNNFATREEALQ